MKHLAGTISLAAAIGGCCYLVVTGHPCFAVAVLLAGGFVALCAMDG